MRLNWSLDVLQVTLAHVLDAELGKVAVHDYYVVPFHVIQVTRHQYGECRFAGSSLLGGEGDEQILQVGIYAISQTCSFAHLRLCLYAHEVTRLLAI